jgi:succinoglycan biosynthesis protein ExoM
MVGHGSRIVWSEEAIVLEPITPARLSLQWLLQRALSGGQEFTRKTMAGRYGPINWLGRTTLLLRAALQLSIAGTLALLTWPTGKHRGAAWLIKAAANLGKLSVFWGWRYNEYA